MHGQHPKRKGPGGDCVGGMTSRRGEEEVDQVWPHHWTGGGQITVFQVRLMEHQ